MIQKVLYHQFLSSVYYFEAYRRTDHLFGCDALLRPIWDVALKSTSHISQNNSLLTVTSSCCNTLLAPLLAVILL